MGNCYFMGTFLILLLGSFCLWNCLHREEPTRDIKWHGCRDQEGRQVDSFILYKLPEDSASQNKLIRDGLAYMYLTPDTPDSLKQSGGVSSVLSYTDTAAGWLLSNRSIADPRSMPGHTLEKLYSKQSYSFMKANSVFLMYNDEFPNGTTSVTHGHTKGVVVMTEQGGFWLVHSTPRYPPIPGTFQGLRQWKRILDQHLKKMKENGSHLDSASQADDLLEAWQRTYHRLGNGSSTESLLSGEGSYDYPATGRRYGQTFMCISLPPEQADNLGWQLLQYKPYIYLSNIGTALRGRFPVLERVLAGHQPPPESVFRVTQLATQQGNTLTSFAKFTKFGKDLYSGLVAKVLETPLLVESWRNGPKPLPSQCNNSDYRVENIERLAVRVSSSSFSTHHDHSKWAVSSDSAKPYVCIGDINRMTSQFHRAGGTVCVWSQTIWNRFYRLVTQVESCSRRKG